MKPLLLSIRCSRCGNDMVGEGASRIYACLHCGIALFMERAEETYPFRALKPARDGERLLWAPYWRVKGEARWQAQSAEKGRAYAHAKPLKALYFPAFSTLKSGQYDNLTIRYALLDEPIAEEARPDMELLPGLLDPRSLPEMARLTWLAYLDRIMDVTGLELDFTVRQIAYAAVPFVSHGDGWEDGQIGLPYPESYFRAARL